MSTFKPHWNLGFQLTSMWKTTTPGDVGVMRLPHRWQKTSGPKLPAPYLENAMVSGVFQSIENPWFSPVEYKGFHGVSWWFPVKNPLNQANGCDGGLNLLEIIRQRPWQDFKPRLLPHRYTKYVLIRSHFGSSHAFWLKRPTSTRHVSISDDGCLRHGAKRALRHGDLRAVGGPWQ